MSIARIGARGLPPPTISETPSDTPAPAAATVRPAGADGPRARGAGSVRSAPRAPAGPAPMRLSSPPLELAAHATVRDGEVPRDETGNRYDTLPYVRPGTGQAATVAGHVRPNGRFDVHDPTSHEPLGSLRIVDAKGSDGPAKVGVDAAGLKGGARGDYRDRHGVLRDRDGRRVVYASSSQAGPSQSAGRPSRAQSSSPDSELAYGPYDGPRAGFEASLGDMRFSSTRNAGDMRRVSQFVADLPGYFQSTREAAGPITVRFGRAPGGGVGCWDPGSRSVILDPNHRHVQAGGTPRLLGAAAFEIINAASERTRRGIEDDARSGALERDAAGSRFTPAQLYGREMERLEFRNAQFHRQMIADAGLGGTRADLFGGESRDFESYYARQVASGHTRSYEDHYNFLRPGPVVMPGPSWRG